MTRSDVQYCQRCVHFGRTASGDAICEYCLNERKSRAQICPAGVGCTERRLRQKPKRQRRRDIVVSRKPPKLKKIVDDRAMQLYRSGASDYRIAQEFGIQHSAVCNWRKVRNLPPNREQGWQNIGKKENLQ